ncbi:DUF3833 domain-containing protein [Endozoicomonas sp. Mp262]|uniref:DUF3833 domain-containing protein n=1 Tax=Endozoicomonas sp. Mp262 TaxID=2919499 RepID=UPI0021D8522A
MKDRICRLGVLFIVIFSLAGCSSMNIDEFAGNEPELKIEEYFQGKTWAWGIVEDRFGQLRRSFKVVMNGDYKNNQLILDEDFFYDDGTLDKRIWKIDTLEGNRYRGTAEGVIGTATGKRAGNAFNWQYEMDLEISGRKWRVKFDDWLFLQPDGVLINRATISKWGITLGSLTFVFTKQEPGQ